MRRDITSWYSHNLNMDMPIVAYGDRGYPLLMFPTAAADYLEYERFYLVDAIKDLIEAGKIRAYSINSVNKYSLLNKESHPAWTVAMSGSYDIYNYLEQHFDDNVYYNNPAMYLKNLDDDYHLPRLRQGDFVV